MNEYLTFFFFFQLNKEVNLAAIVFLSQYEHIRTYLSLILSPTRSNRQIGLFSANSLADIAAHAASAMSYRTAVKMCWTYLQRFQHNENHLQTKNNAGLTPNKGKAKQT